MSNNILHIAQNLHLFYEQFQSWENLSCTINHSTEESNVGKQRRSYTRLRNIPLIDDRISELFHDNTATFEQFFSALDEAIGRNIFDRWIYRSNALSFASLQNGTIVFTIQHRTFETKLKTYQEFCNQLILVFQNQTAPFIHLLTKIEKCVSNDSPAWEEFHAYHVYASKKLQLLKQQRQLVQNNLKLFDELREKDIALKEKIFGGYTQETLQKELACVSSLNKESIQKQLFLKSILLDQLLEHALTSNDKRSYFQEKICLLFALGDSDGIPRIDEKTADTVFHYAAAIGDLTPFNAIKERHAERFLDLFQMPGDNGMSCLHVAFICKQYAVAQALVKMGMDLNAGDNRYYTPLHYLVMSNDLEGMKICLSDPACISAAKTVYGSTAIHLAAAKGHSDILKFLLSHEPDQSPIHEVDLFGKTPLEYAIENKKDEAIKILGNFLTDFEVKNIEGYGKKKAEINQNPVLKAMKAYLKLQGRSLDILPKKGHCSGFLFSALYYFAIGKKRELFHSLSLISSWDRTEKSLAQRDSELSEYYLNLGDLFEQRISDIIWFQANISDLIPLGERNWNLDRLHHFSIIQKLGQDMRLETLFTPRQFYFPLDKEQLVQLLAMWLPIPGAILELTLTLKKFKTATEAETVGHGVGIMTLPDGRMQYYDSNIPFEVMPFNSPEVLAEFIERTVYFDKRLSSRAMAISFFHVFTFVKGSAKTEPISLKINPTVESQYPFPMEMHKAIYEGNIEHLQALLQKPEEKLNRIDYFGMIPLELAVALKRYEMVKILLKQPKVFLNVELLSWVVKIDDKEIVELFLDHPKIPKNMYEYLRVGSFALLKEVMKRGVIDLFEKKSANLNAFLSIQDRRWLEELLNVIPDLNRQDHEGCTLLAHAIRVNNTLLQDLLG